MWKSFFLYTRGEQRGIILLLILIMVVLVVRFSMPYWASRIFNSQEGFDEDFVKQVHELNAQLIAQRDSENVDSFFYFNPNKVTDNQLKSLGFTNYQIKSFMGYRSKVKNFTTDTDLLKVYGIDSAFFAKLQGYIVLDSIITQSSIKQSTPKDSKEDLVWVNFNKLEPSFWDENIISDSIRLKIAQMMAHNHIIKSLPMEKVQDYTDEELYHWMVKNSKPRHKDTMEDLNLPIETIELNTADTAQLCLLKGIGSKLSVRIINFRNSLGGFYHVLQLSDVYGISDELFDSLRNQVFVDEAHLQKIEPQNLSIEEISKHPYINYYQAKELKNLYRKNIKPTAADIMQLKSISDNDWEKLKHYLIISE